MMCGTPTIAFELGSMPEIIEHGVTGFLAAGVDDAVTMVDCASSLDRANCRRVAEHRFSASRMVDDYIAVYHDVVGAQSRNRAVGR
jgi:glycosyltransferase involved in cell wall biosynthesis